MKFGQYIRNHLPSGLQGSVNNVPSTPSTNAPSNASVSGGSNVPSNAPSNASSTSSNATGRSSSNESKRGKGLRQQFRKVPLELAFRKVPKGTHEGVYERFSSNFLGVKRKTSSQLPEKFHSIVPPVEQSADQIPAQFLQLFEQKKEPFRLDEIFGGAATEPGAAEKYERLKAAMGKIQETLLEKKLVSHGTEPSNMGLAEARAFGVNALLASVVEKESEAAVKSGGMVSALNSLTAGLSQLQELKLSPEALRGKNLTKESVEAAQSAMDEAVAAAQAARAAVKAKGLDISEADATKVRALAAATAKADALAAAAEAGVAGAGAANAFASITAATREKVAAYKEAADVDPAIAAAIAAIDKATAATEAYHAAVNAEEPIMAAASTAADAVVKVEDAKAAVIAATQATDLAKFAMDEAVAAAQAARAAVQAKGLDINETDAAKVRALAVATAKADALAAAAEKGVAAAGAANAFASITAATREKVAAYREAADVDPAIAAAIAAIDKATAATEAYRAAEAAKADATTKAAAAADVANAAVKNATDAATAAVTAARAAKVAADNMATDARNDAAAKATAAATAPGWNKPALSAAATAAAAAEVAAEANVAAAAAALAKAEAASEAVAARIAVAKADAANAAGTAAAEATDLARFAMDQAVAAAKEKNIDVDDVAAKMHAVTTTTSEAEALVAAAEEAARRGAAPADVAKAIDDANAAIARNDAAKAAVAGVDDATKEAVTAISKAVAAFTAADTAQLVAAARATAAADAAKAAVSKAGDAAAEAVVAEATAAAAAAKMATTAQADEAARNAVAAATSARIDAYARAAEAGRVAAAAVAAVSAARGEIAIKAAEKEARAAHAAKAEADAAVIEADAALATAVEDAKAAVAADKAAKAQALKTAWSLASHLAESYSGTEMLRKLTGYPETGVAKVDEYNADMLRVYLRAANRFAEENPEADGTPMSLDPASIYAKLGEIRPEDRTIAAKALFAVQGHLAAADILNHPDRKENFDPKQIEVSHQWALPLVRSGRFVDAARDNDGKLLSSPPATAPAPAEDEDRHPRKLQKRRPPSQSNDGAGLHELEQLAQDMATDAEKSLHKTKDEILAFRAHSNLAKRRVEGAGFGAQEYAGVAQIRALRDQMLGTLVQQIDVRLKTQFNVEFDDDNNILRLAPKPGAVLDDAAVRLLVRRELAQAVVRKGWMFNSAEGVPLYGPDKDAVLARVELAMLASHGIDPGDEKRKQQLMPNIAKIVEEQNNWNDAPKDLKRGQGRSLVPEQFVQWADDLGAPRQPQGVGTTPNKQQSWLMKPIDPAEPPPAKGSLEELWAPFRMAFHATRYGNPTPVVSQELHRLRPDRNAMRMALRETVGDVMRARYPDDPQAQEREAIQAIKAGDRQLMEGAGRLKKKKDSVTGELLKKISRQKGDVDYSEKVSWAKKIGVDIHYQGHRLIDGNIGNEQGDVGPDAVKATFAALGLDWPKTSLTKKALHIRHTDVRAEAVQPAIEHAARQFTDDFINDYSALVLAELQNPSSEAVRNAPGNDSRRIVHELVKGLPPEVADDSDALVELTWAAVNRHMARETAKAVMANLYPTAPQPEAEQVLEGLIYSRLNGITGQELQDKLGDYSSSQIMAGMLAAATSGRKEDAVAAMTRLVPRQSATLPHNMPLTIGKAVDKAFEAALEKGRTAAANEVFYNNIARNELGGSYQLRSEAQRGFGLDAFVTSASVPLKAAAEATGIAHFFSGSVSVRPLVGRRWGSGLATGHRISAVGAEINYGKSATGGRQYGLGAGFTASGGVPAVHLQGGASADTVFYSKDVRDTQGLIVRGAREGVANEPAIAKEQAHAYSQLAFPTLDNKERRMDEADKRSSIKRMLQDNPFLSVGQYRHVETTRQGSVGFGGNLGVKVGTVSARALQVSRLFSGIRVEEEYDDHSGSIQVQRRVVTKIAKRETVMATAALSVGLAPPESKYSVSESLMAGKSIGSSSRKLEVNERRHLLFKDGKLLGNSFIGQSSNHMELLLDIALQHNPMPFELLVQFHHHKGKKPLPEMGKSSAARDAADLRAKEEYEELFDEKNDHDPVKLKQREEVLEATRRHFAEFLSRMDQKNGNQQLVLCSDVTPEAAEKVTMLLSLKNTEKDPARKQKWQEEIDNVMEKPESWAPINFVLNVIDGRRERKMGLRGWAAGLAGMVRTTQDSRGTSIIRDAM